jgi:hypothetical protein
MKDPKGPTKPYRSSEEIAKKHKVPLDKIISQVKIGTKIEGEHTTSKSGAKITALQHVDELPDYYTRLKKVEKKKPMKEEITQYQNDTKYCLLCKKNEKKEECSWGPSMWDKYTIAKINPANESRIHEDHKEIASGKKKDEEGYMARVEFDQIERAVDILRKHIKKRDQQLPAWVQSKITRAADFIDTAAEYMSSDEDVSEGFKPLDKEKVFNKMREKDRIRSSSESKPSDTRITKKEPISNVSGKDRISREIKLQKQSNMMNLALKNPDGYRSKGSSPLPRIKTEQKNFNQFMTEGAAWQRKEGKNKEGGLNEKGRKSYERENPGSDLKAPQPEGGPRKRSFCARMGGMKGPMKDEKGRPTRKALALRKWKC